MCRCSQNDDNGGRVEVGSMDKGLQAGTAKEENALQWEWKAVLWS